MISPVGRWNSKLFQFHAAHANFMLALYELSGCWYKKCVIVTSFSWFLSRINLKARLNKLKLDKNTIYEEKLGLSGEFAWVIITNLLSPFNTEFQKCMKFRKQKFYTALIRKNATRNETLLSLVHMHNIHPGANIHPGCKFAPGVYFGHVNGVLWKYTRVQISIRVRICSTSLGGANMVEQISIRVHICPQVQIAHMNATCYHICTI